MQEYPGKLSALLQGISSAAAVHHHFHSFRLIIRKDEPLTDIFLSVKIHLRQVIVLLSAPLTIILPYWFLPFENT
jgi:hypothetical protein